MPFDDTLQQHHIVFTILLLPFTEHQEEKHSTHCICLGSTCVGQFRSAFSLSYYYFFLELRLGKTSEIPKATMPLSATCPHLWNTSTDGEPTIAWAAALVDHCPYGDESFPNIQHELSLLQYKSQFMWTNTAQSSYLNTMPDAVLCKGWMPAQLSPSVIVPAPLSPFKGCHLFWVTLTAPVVTEPLSEPRISAGAEGRRAKARDKTSQQKD